MSRHELESDFFVFFFELNSYSKKIKCIFATENFSLNVLVIKILLPMENNMSYTGEVFNFQKDLKNRYDILGKGHNILMDIISDIWPHYKEGDLYNVSFLDFLLKQTEKITGIAVNSVYSSRTDFETLLIENLRADNKRKKSVKKEDSTYMGLAKAFFMQFPDYYFESFFSDIQNFAYGEGEFATKLKQIDIIEQKVFFSKIVEPWVKDYYLMFCAIARYSLINAEKIINNEESPFYEYFTSNNPDGGEKKAGGKGDLIIADATGFVHGAYIGATAGVAGGPAGSVILGAVGGVCVGGLSSAVEVGLKKTVSDWIDSWL